MSRYLPLRAFAITGILGAALALGAAGSANAAAPPAGVTGAGYQTAPGASPWCQFLLWITGRDICALTGGGGNPGPPPPTEPPTTLPPPTVPPPTVPATPPPPPPVPTTQAPPSTAPEAPTTTAAPATLAPAVPIEAPAGPPPPQATTPPAAAPERAPAVAARPATATTAAPQEVSTSAPPAADPVVAAVPATYARSPGFIEPDVVLRTRRPLLDEPVRSPMTGERSLIQSVITSTSGPIGRRLVALAGVLVAMLLGILAARIDDRTHVVRRLHERFHVDES